MRATLHRLAVAIATIAACSVLSTPAAQNFIDAANMRIADGPDATKVALCGAADMHLAQTLTIQAGGTAMGVFLPVTCESGSLIVRLRDKDGDFPGSAILALGQVDAADQPVAASFTYVPFYASAAVEAKSQLSLDVEAVNGTCTFSFSPANSDYAGGNGWFRGVYTDQTWVRLPLDLTGDDLPFQLLMQPAAPSETTLRPTAQQR